MASPQVDKSIRYDRQLRLWGDHGQESLEKSHVCLINASATGTEILKNLVLPGIGAFTILDSCTVTEEDLGNNFFLERDSLGKSRAACVLTLLQELNPEVKGSAVEKNLETILLANSAFFTKFSVVIATNLGLSLLSMLAEVLWRESIPLLVAKCVGMIGYLRLVMKEHAIIESKPDNPIEDLRLDQPFPALVQYARCIDLGKLEDSEHRQVPFPLILLEYLKQWKDGHSGEIPKNYKEKKEFKTLVESGKRSVDEENFDEACKAINTSVSKYSLPSEVREILEDPACSNLQSDSTNFWVLVRALSDFVHDQGNGQLPLRGSIPDMFSSSDKYIGLQRLYQSQAKMDADVVGSHVTKLLAQLGRPENSISKTDIQHFCHNSAFLRLIRGRSLAQEYEAGTFLSDNLDLQLDNPDSIAAYYILLRAGEVFHRSCKRYPGTDPNCFEGDVINLTKISKEILSKDLSLPSAAVREDFVVEYCRSGSAELHSVAAFIGGVAGQEVIKLVTHQYVPFNNTFIYDAITSTSCTLEL